jgi:hypothetical protein
MPETGFARITVVGSLVNRGEKPSSEQEQILSKKFPYTAFIGFGQLSYGHSIHPNEQKTRSSAEHKSC